jgi:hypothetical protein
LKIFFLENNNEFANVGIEQTLIRIKNGIKFELLIIAGNTGKKYENVSSLLFNDLAIYSHQ